MGTGKSAASSEVDDDVEARGAGWCIAVNGQVLRVVRYRSKVTFGRRWGSYLALALLIGLVGGIAMGSIAAARRTQSSFPRFLASTNPSDLNISSYVVGSNSTSPSARLSDQIARLPQVKRVRSLVALNAAPLGPDGTPLSNTFADNFTQQLTVGSVDGLFSAQDRVAVVRGRMANPERADEFMMTSAAAHLLGLRVGQVVPLAFYSNQQAPPVARITVKLVGLVVFNTQVVQDDVDRLPTVMLFSPALTRSVLATSDVVYYGLQLVHGGRDVSAVERAVVGLLPPGTSYSFHITSRVEAQVERALKPEAIALGAFGAIASVAALFIAVQTISRQIREGDEDLRVLRALGAAPRTTASDGLIGILGAVVVGSLLACGVAIALSPLSPLGPVRQIDPSRGITLDWTVLGPGLLVLIGGLGAIAVVLGIRGAPHRVARHSMVEPVRSSSVVRVAASSGLSAAGVVGVRFALEPGRGRTAVPVRSALSGTALAVFMLVATLTFGSGLHTLVSHPPLYGWNWNYLLNPTSNVPPQALTLLDRDSNVAAWTGVKDANVQVDGQNVPVLGGDAPAQLTPPILSGHALTGKDQIVLGAATLARLHKRLGDTVVVTYGAPQDAPAYIPPTRLVIVGTATLPAVGYASIIADHPSMGTGALVSKDIQSAAMKEAQINPDPTLNGPNHVFVRLRSGISPASGRADMQRIADAANKAFAAAPNGDGIGSTVAVLSVQRPAEIVNYRSMGATPAILAAGLAGGAIVALGLTLAASVRRRRRDLALLKTLGFTRRQLAATVAWQASVAAVVGLVIGVPLGIAAGRWLWTLFAREIYAVPKPTVPSSVILVALGVLVLANVVAALPGRSAARTSAALVLRAE